MGAAVTNANEEIHLLPAPAELHQVDEFIQVVNNVIDGSDDAADSWEPLLSKVELFSQIIDNLAQVRFVSRYSPPGVMTGFLGCIDTPLCSDCMGSNLRRT